MDQFVGNLKGDREKAASIILNNELLLMQQLNYHLTIHNPFRPLEGEALGACRPATHVFIVAICLQE